MTFCLSDITDVFLTFLLLHSLRCLLFLLLLTLATDAQVLSLSQMYGSIKSPNFPEPYPNETELRWNVSIPEGFRVKLYFTHFDLEPSYLCEYDFVKVRAQSIMGSVRPLYLKKTLSLVSPVCASSQSPDLTTRETESSKEKLTTPISLSLSTHTPPPDNRLKSRMCVFVWVCV